MSVVLDDSGTSQDEDRELAFESQDEHREPSKPAETKHSTVAELEALFANRYTMEEPAYTKLATEGIPPPICVFPYRPNIRGPDNGPQRGGWRGGGGGRHRQYGNRPERNDRQGGSGGGGWRSDRRDDWNSDSRRGGRQRSRSPPRRNY